MANKSGKHYYPSIDDCNAAIDWLEEWQDDRQTFYPESNVARLKISNSGN